MLYRLKIYRLGICRFGRSGSKYVKYKASRWGPEVRGSQIANVEAGTRQKRMRWKRMEV